MLAMLSLPPRAHAPADAAGSPAGLGTLHAPSGAERGGLDAGALARLAELDPTGESRLVERVLQAFRASVVRLRPQLDAARRSGDRSAIRLVVHTLKSSSASIGALTLSQLCAQIEAVIRVDAAAELSAPLAALDTALDDALLAIGTLLKESV
jgi:HPt (histidine-containing phosphotransfer) domain-containing protein